MGVKHISRKKKKPPNGARGHRIHFETFGEQMAKLKLPKLPIATYLASDIACDDLNASCLAAAMEKWRELNLSQQFSELCDACHRYVGSLRQLLHNKDKLVSILEDAAKSALDALSGTESAAPLALEPLLELWVALARDLQELFLPHYESFCDVFLRALTARDVAVIKTACCGINEVVRLLQRCVLLGKGSTNLLDLVDPLMTGMTKWKVPEVTHKFVAEALSHVVRKSNAQRECLLDYLLHAATKGQRVQFVANIVVSACKFTTFNEKLFGSLASYFFEQGKGRDVEVDFFKHLLESACSVYSQPEYAACAESLISEAVRRGANPTLVLKLTGYVMHSANAKVAPRFIFECLAKELTPTLKSRENCPPVGEFAQLLRALFEKAPRDDREVQRSLSTILETFLQDAAYEFEEKNSVMEALATVWCFDSLCFGKLISFWAGSSAPSRSELLSVAETVVGVSKLKCESIDWQSYVFEMAYEDHGALATIPNKIAALLLDAEEDSSSHAALLECLIFLRPLNSDLARDVLKSMASRILPIASSTDTTWKHMLWALTRAMVKLICPKDILAFFAKDLLELAATCCDDVRVSEALALISISEDGGVSKILPSLEDELVKGLSNADGAVRLNCVKVLANITRSEVYALMQQAEEIEISVQTFRDRLIILEQVKAKAEGPRLQEAVVRYLSGNMQVSFSLLWKPLMKIIDDVALEMNQDAFWTIMEDIFSRVCSKARQGSERTEETPRVNILQLFANLSVLNEKNCRFVTNEFLDAFLRDELPKASKRKIPSLNGFLKVLARFQNLSGAKRFKEVESVCFSLLSDQNTSTQSEALTLICNASKEVRHNKESLSEMTESAKWKDCLRGIAEKSSERKFVGVLRHTLIELIIGALRKTTKEKGKRQMDMRRFILEQSSLIDQTFLSDLLNSLLMEVAPETAARYRRSDAAVITKATFLERKYSLEMALDICVLSSSLVKDETTQAFVDNCVVDLICIFGEKALNESDTVLSKIRSKVLAAVNKVFKGLKALDLSVDQRVKIVDSCAVPVMTLNSDLKREKVSPKMMVLVNTWLENDKFRGLFFVKGRGSSVVEVIADHLTRTSDKVFVNRLADSMCSLICFLNASDSPLAVTNTEVLWRPLLTHMTGWLSAKGRQLSKGGNFPVMLAAMKVIIENFGELTTKDARDIAECLSTIPVALIEAHVIDWFAVFSVAVPKCDRVPEKVFQLMWLLQEAYYRPKVGKLLCSKIGISVSYSDITDPHELVSKYEEHDPQRFQYVVYCCLWSLHNNDLGQMTTALNSALTLLEKLNKRLSDGDFNALCQHYVLKQVQRGIRHRQENSYAAFIAILQSVLKTGRVSTLQDLSSLCIVDEEETDFLENMKHLQLHRRGRAFRNLVKRITDGEVKMTISTLFHYIRPMASRYLFTPTYTKNSELIAASISVLGATSLALNLQNYLKMLDEFIRVEPSDRPFVKQKFQVISAIMDSFHFKGEDLTEAMLVKLKKCVAVLLESVKSEETAHEGNLSVFVAVAKISSICPKDFRNLVQTLLLDLCHKLRSRDHKFRQLVRVTMAEVMNVLGPSYLFFLFTLLETSLQRGYQVHILINTMGYIMKSLEDVISGDAVKSVLAKCLNYVNQELFANLAKEKKVKAIYKKTPEAEKTNSFQILTIIGKKMGKDCVQDLLRPFLKPFFITPKAEKLEMTRSALASILAGFGLNEDFAYKDLLLLAYGIMTNKVAELAIEETGGPIAALHQEFVFNLLLTATKKATVLSLEEAKPFLTKIIDGLEEKNVSVVLTSLRLFTFMLHQKEVVEYLKTEKMANTVLRKMTGNLKRLFAVKDERVFAQCCVVIGRLLRVCEDLSGDIVTALKTFFMSCLDREQTQSPRILLAVLRHVPVEETKQLAFKLCKTFVECQRERTAEAIKFMLLQQKTLKEYSLEFMLQNIDYASPQGRKRTVAFIRELTKDSDDNLFKNFDWNRLFLLATNRFVQEEVDEIRNELRSVLKIVLARHFSNASSAPGIADTVLVWCKSEKPLLLAMASKVAIVISEVEHEKALSFVSTLIGSLDDRGLIFKAYDSDNVGAAVILSSVMDMVTNIVSSPLPSDGIQRFLSRRHDDLCNAMLHPNSHLRAKVMALTALVLVKATEKPSNWEAWTSPKLLAKVGANIFTLSKSSQGLPSSCLSVLTSIACAFWPENQPEDMPLPKRFNRFFKGCKDLIFFEKSKDPTTFERRKLVLLLLREIVTKCVTEDLHVPKSKKKATFFLEEAVGVSLRSGSATEVAEEASELLTEVKRLLSMEEYANMIACASKKRKRGLLTTGLSNGHHAEVMVAKKKRA